MDAVQQLVNQINAGQAAPPAQQQARPKLKLKQQPSQQPQQSRSQSQQQQTQPQSQPQQRDGRKPTTTQAQPPVALDPSTAPLAKRLKDVLDHLLHRNGQQLSAADLLRGTGLDLASPGQADLAAAAAAHPRIRVHVGPSAVGEPALYAYRPEIAGVPDRAALLTRIRDHRGPALLRAQLATCYAGAADDLDDMKRRGQVYVVGDAVFPRDDMGMGGVGDDVRALWHEVAQEHVPGRVPRGALELQQAVVAAGLRSAQGVLVPPAEAAGGRGGTPRKRRERKFNVDKATNSHLPFLFTGAQPKSLDA